MNLYHVTKLSPYCPFILYCFYTKIRSFVSVLTIGIVRGCFYLLIFYSEKFSTLVWRLPFAVNVNLNLFIGHVLSLRFRDRDKVEVHKNGILYGLNTIFSCHTKQAVPLNRVRLIELTLYENISISSFGIKPEMTLRYHYKRYHRIRVWAPWKPNFSRFLQVLKLGI